MNFLFLHWTAVSVWMLTFMKYFFMITVSGGEYDFQCYLVCTVLHCYVSLRLCVAYRFDQSTSGPRESGVFVYLMCTPSVWWIQGPCLQQHLKCDAAVEVALHSIRSHTLAICFNHKFSRSMLVFLFLWMGWKGSCKMCACKNAAKVHPLGVTATAG